MDLDKKVIRFAVTKGDRPYSIPMSDALAQLLTRYRASADVPPSEWVFPSPAIEGAQLVDVKNPKEGVGPGASIATLAELGAAPEQARGHSMGGDVSRGYIFALLVVESLRQVTNAIAAHYLKIVTGIV